MANQAEGFTTLIGLTPAFVFHIVCSAAGLQLITAAAKRADAEKSAEQSEQPAQPEASATSVA